MVCNICGRYYSHKDLSEGPCSYCLIPDITLDDVPEQPEEVWEEETKYSFSRLFHNAVGHPIMGICQFFGAFKIGNWIHDITLPKEYRD